MQTLQSMSPPCQKVVLFELPKEHSSCGGGFFIFLGLGVAALVLAAVAVAGTVTATATVTGAGSLSLSNGATASISDTLDGTDQSVNYTLPLTMNDLRGSGAGWNLTMTSTAFTNGTQTLGTAASSIASAADHYAPPAAPAPTRPTRSPIR